VDRARAKGRGREEKNRERGERIDMKGRK